MKSSVTLGGDGGGESFPTLPPPPALPTHQAAGGGRRRRHRGARPCPAWRGSRCSTGWPGRPAGYSARPRWCREQGAPQRRDGQGSGPGKVLLQISTQGGRQAALHGTEPHQHHRPARKWLLHRKAGVAEGPDIQRCVCHGEPGGEYLPAAPAQKAEHSLYGQHHPARAASSAPGERGR